MRKPPHTVFEYLYRDASNYKAYGEVLLKGSMSGDAVQKLKDCLEDFGVFVAEQVGIPVLCEELYQYSDGPTDDDHAYHEFVLCRKATPEDIDTLPLWGSTQHLLAIFQKAKEKWNVMLSPHADPYWW